MGFNLRRVRTPYCKWESLPKPYGMMKTNCGFTVEPATIDGHGRIINYVLQSGGDCHRCNRTILIEETDRWHESNIKPWNQPREVKK